MRECRLMQKFPGCSEHASRIGVRIQHLLEVEGRGGGGVKEVVVVTPTFQKPVFKNTLLAGTCRNY